MTMLILVVRSSHNVIIMDIYRWFQTKKMVHVLTINADLDGIGRKLQVYDSDSAMLVDEEIEVVNGDLITDKLNAIFRHKSLLSYEFNFIINKINNGGSYYVDINLFHGKTMSELGTIDSSLEQKQQLDICEYLSRHFLKAKHYFCYDSGFYSTISSKQQAYLGKPANLENGLIMFDISQKLLKYVINKEAKKTWLNVSIEHSSVIFTVIKKFKCLVSYKLAVNYAMPDQLDLSNNDLYNINNMQIAQVMTQLITIFNGVFGIIISGGLGTKDARIRKQILDQLSWCGIILSNKKNNLNKHFINKKISTVKIVLINGNECDAMVSLLSNRVLLDE